MIGCKIQVRGRWYKVTAISFVEMGINQLLFHVEGPFNTGYSFWWTEITTWMD